MGAVSEQRDLPRAATGPEAPTSQFVAARGEGCPACGNPMASDQRYCLACGERRGGVRLPALEPLPTPEVVPEARPPARATWSSGATLVAGIATLLLAMGVGVLIGRTGQGNGKVTAAAPAQVITVGASGTGAAAPGSGTAGPRKQIKVPKHIGQKPLTKKVVVKAQAAAAKVLGGSNLPPPTVKVGQPGHGPGFQNGRFTGNFFGP